MARPPLIAARLKDETAEQVRRSHAEAISELQRAIQPKIFRNVVLEPLVETPIQHGLGRAPQMIVTSPPRGAGTTGMIVEFDSTFSSGIGIDRTKIIVLRAQDFGATITVDVMVF